MRDLDQIRFFSQNFPNLQGLKLVPWSLWYIGSAWTMPYWGPREGTLTGLFIYLACVTSLIILHEWIRSYYQRAFGLAYSPSGGCTKILAFVVVLFVINWFEVVLGSPVSVSGLVLAGASWWVWAAGGGRRYRQHYAVVAVIFAVWSLVPLLTGAAPPEPNGSGTTSPYDHMGETLLGLMLLAVGIFDHLLLVRHLPLVSEEGHENAV